MDRAKAARRGVVIGLNLVVVPTILVFVAIHWIAEGYWYIGAPLIPIAIFRPALWGAISIIVLMQRRGPKATEAETAEAESIVAAELARLRTKTYEELLSHKDDALSGDTVPLASGVEVFPEARAFWEDRRLGHLRVRARVWRAEHRRFRTPIAEGDFIVTPAGNFIGE